MPNILLRETLAFEDVAEMAVAVFAQDLNPVSVGVAFVPHGSGEFVVKTRPATARMKLV